MSIHDILGGLDEFWLSETAKAINLVFGVGKYYCGLV